MKASSQFPSVPGKSSLAPLKDPKTMPVNKRYNNRPTTPLPPVAPFIQSMSMPFDVSARTFHGTSHIRTAAPELYENIKKAKLEVDETKPFDYALFKKLTS